MQSRRPKKRGWGPVTLLIIILLFLLLIFPGRILFDLKDLFTGESGLADQVHYESQNIYVYNLTDGEVVFEKNSRERVAPASLTKIMTVYAALRRLDDLSELAPVDTDAYLEMVAGNASMAGFYGNEQTSYRDLLYGTMLASGGECAKSLAINLDGTEENFVDDMNAIADQLGLTNTHFVNPEGFDAPGQYSSAEDIGRLLVTALDDGDFYVLFTTPSFLSRSTPDHPDGLLIESTVLSKLTEVDWTDYRILGGKSGTTDRAGLCWATLAEKNEKQYIIVVMGAPFESDYSQGDGQILDTLQILENLD